ncbi:MAG: F0F1 ATP synthase subunit gamma [Rhodanobacteraceae bacterium]
MASGREIKTKIKSVQNTRKVTSALQMVSASKIRKAQDLMSGSRPYARAMRNVISHLAHANTEYKHPFLIERETVKKVGFVVISTDRGLCGGLNANLFRKMLGEIRQWQDKGVGVEVVAIGQKAVQFFRRIKGVELIGSTTHLGERPKLESLIGVIKVVLDAYENGNIDRVFLCYNDFVNTMRQDPRVDALLPLPVVAAEIESGDQQEQDRVHATVAADRQFDWDYLYEPDAETVLEHLMQRYIESLVYQSVLENLASEQAARMVAMKSASDNASNLIDELTLIYNKARQAAITQEISEIVSGAAAV